MKHFYKKIPGWFSFRAVYARAVAEARDGAHFVEIGCWKGRSAAFMAVEIINSGKRIRFDCVDTWLGSKEPKHQSDPSVINGTLYFEFLANLVPVRRQIKVIRRRSVEAAKLYRNESIDLAFIDAAHDEKNVLADIAAWWPKIRVGGVLAGDDATASGVSAALKMAFGSDFELIRGDGSGRQWRKRRL